MKRPRPVPAISTVTIPLGIPTSIASVFELMRIAEDELDAYRTQHGAEPAGGFKLLCPPAGMSQLDHRVYRAHVRELLGRVKKLADDPRAIVDTRLATNAECLVALLQAATTAPPRALYAGLIEKLFVEVFGTLPDGVDASRAPREPWTGAHEEELRSLQRKLATADRFVE